MYHRFCRKSRKKIKELNAKKTKNLTELRLIFPGSFYIKEHSRTSMTLEHIFQKASNIIDIIEKKNKNKNKKKKHFQSSESSEGFLMTLFYFNRCWSSGVQFSKIFQSFFDSLFYLLLFFSKQIR